MAARQDLDRPGSGPRPRVALAVVDLLVVVCGGLLLVFAVLVEWLLRQRTIAWVSGVGGLRT